MTQDRATVRQQLRQRRRDLTAATRIAAATRIWYKNYGPWVRILPALMFNVRATLNF